MKDEMSSLEIEQLLSQIGNFGFPLVLAIYLLIRFEKKIEKLTEVISQLENNIKELKK
ncbi:YvrJ family protein [Bacillus halotolerans]|uniref:YvrJ family protein n=1 Tax=Bacillus halotolerans TaxID=260554 RepID=UPI00280AEBDC|nr:YvrJ family protein [Bacillus halotolerans]